GAGFKSKAPPARRSVLLLPLFYTIFGALTALGVGKVGAYVNYFLEFYAGLIWLAALITTTETTTENQEPGTERRAAASGFRLLARGSQLVAIALVTASLLRY